MRRQGFVNRQTLPEFPSATIRQKIHFHLSTMPPRGNRAKCAELRKPLASLLVLRLQSLPAAAQ
jgi:hypothetical protein